MHIQKVFVILAFNNQLIETLISLIVKIPVIGDKLEAPVRAGLGELCFILYNGLYAVCLSRNTVILFIPHLCYA